MITMPDPEEYLPVAIEAAEGACAEILEVYVSGNFETEIKADRSPLTLADRRAHERIVAVLKAGSPFPVLSEEGRDIPYEERRHWNCFWMVDPLDGTKEFVKRNGEFTVNIALIIQNEPVLGVVAVPVQKATYYAIAGKGAHLIANGVVTVLPRRASADLSAKGLRVVASRSHMNAETASFIEQLTTPTLITVGSSLKFLALATGKADLYPRYIPCMEWDTAAADVILREVGVITLSVDTDQPLKYNKRSLLSPSFICR